MNFRDAVLRFNCLVRNPWLQFDKFETFGTEYVKVPDGGYYLFRAVPSEEEGAFQINTMRVDVEMDYWMDWGTYPQQFAASEVLDVLESLENDRDDSGGRIPNLMLFGQEALYIPHFSAAKRALGERYEQTEYKNRLGLFQILEGLTDPMTALKERVTRFDEQASAAVGMPSEKSLGLGGN